MSDSAVKSGPKRRKKPPKYLQIQEHLRQRVQSGAIGVGQTLPREPALAASMDVAVGTLRQAIQGLVDEGILRRIPGKGTFVNSPQQRRAQVRSSIFSVIVPLLREDPIGSLIEGVDAAAFEMDHQVLFGNSNNEVARQEKLLQAAVDHQVAGVVLVPTTFPLTPPEHVRLLREYHIPFVFCHRVVEGVAAPLVTWPHMDVGRMAARLFVEHGHERIVALADFADVIIEAVGAGGRHVLREQNVDPDNYRLHLFGKLMRGTSVRGEVSEWLKQILEAEHRPTAILCFNSFDAEQVYLLAGELGFKIPDDLSLIYFGSDQRESALAQRITCVAVTESEVGREAIQLLEAMEAGRIPHEHNNKLEIPLTLLLGETVGPAPV